MFRWNPIFYIEISRISPLYVLTPSLSGAVDRSYYKNGTWDLIQKVSCLHLLWAACCRNTFCIIKLSLFSLVFNVMKAHWTFILVLLVYLHAVLLFIFLLVCIWLFLYKQRRGCTLPSTSEETKSNFYAKEFPLDCVSLQGKS